MRLAASHHGNDPDCSGCADIREEHTALRRERDRALDRVDRAAAQSKADRTGKIVSFTDRCHGEGHLVDPSDWAIELRAVLRGAVAEAETHDRRYHGSPLTDDGWTDRARRILGPDLDGARGAREVGRCSS